MNETSEVEEKPITVDTILMLCGYFHTLAQSLFLGITTLHKESFIFCQKGEIKIHLRYSTKNSTLH